MTFIDPAMVAAFVILAPAFAPLQLARHSGRPSRVAGVFGLPSECSYVRRAADR
jgi:hypothetical protein